MTKLPEKFPEYSIMYKTLSSQIESLEKRKQGATSQEKVEIESKIQQYEIEINKIKKMFSDNFFENS